MAVSGEQAVPGDIRNLESLVLYVDTADTAPPADLLIHNRRYRKPHGRIVIRKLFWRTLTEAQPGPVPQP